MFRNPLKDWFFFTRSQRQGILVLIFLILITPLVSRMARQVASLPVCEEKALAELSTIIDKFQQVKSLDPFPFDPNTISPGELKQMGLSERIARNIKNYLDAGGNFRYREDMKKLYQIDDEIYRQLEAFIELPSKDEVYVDISEHDTEVSTGREQIDINSADSVELQVVRGIGPVFGSRISRYRDLLGGFHSVEQLMEVYGIDSARFEQIRPQVHVKTGETKKINLNTVSASELSSHPYIDWAIARAVIALREQHGPFDTVSDIKDSHLVDEHLWKRISPYLKID